MKKSASYRTKQRDYVLECISSGEHMTADDIVTALKLRGNPVGKSTVYRYLNVLAEDGVVRRYFVDENESACYQYISDTSGCHNHYHLKCSACGELIHSESDIFGRLANEIFNSMQFEIDSSKTVFYGKCAKCIEKDSQCN